MRHCLGTTLLCLLLLARSAQPVHAQENDYKSLTNAAVDEHALGHYEEARALFARAHAINPNARTFWGMGMAAFEARQYVDAIHLLSESLKDTRKPLTEAQRKRAESLIERSKDFVVRVRIEVEPASANVSIDGHEVQPDAQGFVLLDAGSHQIVANAEGYQELVRTMRWSAGEAAPLELRLTPEAAASEPIEAAPVATHSPAPRQPTDQPRTGPTAMGVLKWVALGATVAAGGVAGAGYGLRQSAAAEWNDETRCPVPKSESCGDKRDEVQNWELMSIVGGAAAGAFAVATIVFFVLDRPAKRDSALTCAPMLATGATCRVRF